MTATTADALAEEPKRPHRTLRDWSGDQTAASITAGVLGAAALSLLMIGTPVVISTVGWVPSARLTEAITSTAQGVMLWVTLALGLGGAALGWGTYRRMPNRAARETAIGGAVLGAQAVVLAAVFLWVRTGQVDVLIDNYFAFELLAAEGPRFLRAALNTLVLSVAGETIGIVLGLILAVFVLSRRPLVRAPARIYINFFRGTPLIWQLSFGWLGIVLALGLDVGAYLAAMIILGLNAGAYSAEIFRAGIESIDRGQFEAARSLGMSYGKALRHVILPQGVRRVIPPLTNEFVILIKDTSLVFILGLTFTQKELLSTARDLYSGTGNATPWLAAAAGYLVITLPMIRLVRMLEARLRSGLTGIVGAQ